MRGIHMNKDLNYYLNLPWTYHIEWSEPDNCFLGSIIELEINMTDGETVEQTFENLKDALICYLETCMERNRNIPEPDKVRNFKGNIAYRTTPERHYKLAKKASILGKSISKVIDEAIDREIA
jgi:predicted RNase H-like HicB family nuclease